VVERTARGIDTIFYQQLRNGRPAPSYDRSNERSVVLVLPGGRANLNFVRLIEEESQANRPLSLDELLILNHLWLERQITTADVAKLIQKSEADARGRLQRLVEAGLVEPRGTRKGRVWHLSGTVYRRLGQQVAYVRQRGFEPLQQEQMVLQYLSKYSSINRAEAARLCNLSLPQAYRLLKRLEAAGRIRRLSGVTKGTRYGLLNG